MGLKYNKTMCIQGENMTDKEEKRKCYKTFKNLKEHNINKWN